MYKMVAPVGHGGEDVMQIIHDNDIPRVGDKVVVKRRDGHTYQWWEVVEVIRHYYQFEDLGKVKTTTEFFNATVVLGPLKSKVGPV